MAPTASRQVITHAEGLWTAVHDRSRVDGPLQIACADDVLLRDVTFHVDDLGADLALLDRFRVYCKGGVATVEASGHFPVGAGVGMSQTLRYAANHVRAVSDLAWRKGATITRHLGVGSLFLPGPWQRVYCIPPCLHLAEGRLPAWENVPASASASGMIGHWHRPPLALVFERPDGTRVEVGTGRDIWRWEEGLGFGPEAANCKIIIEDGGLRFVREPLMTCTEVQPVARPYRLTWYLAWQSAAMRQAQTSFPEPVPVRFTPQGEALVRDAAAGVPVPSLLLDLDPWPRPPQGCRVASAAAFYKGEREASLCWESAVVQKPFRRMIRQIAALGPEGYLTLRGLGPGACWDPAHCERRGEPLPHWDLPALLDLGAWGRQQLGPGWQVRVVAADGEMLPSMAGLFAPTGFAPAWDGSADA